MKKQSSQKIDSYDWITECMRSIVRIMNAGKPVNMLIENSDSLANFMTCQLPIHAPVHDKLLDILLTSQSYNPRLMLWLTAHGTLHGINTLWTYELDKAWLDSSVQHLETWQQNALFLSAKTDALFVYADPEQHLFTIITQGTAYEKLRIEQVIAMLSKKFSSSPLTAHSKVASHESFDHRQYFSQHTS